MPISVGAFKTVELGAGDALDDGEALAGAVLEIAGGVFTIQAMEELPGSVTEWKKGLRSAVTR